MEGSMNSFIHDKVIEFVDQYGLRKQDAPKNGKRQATLEELLIQLVEDCITTVHLTQGIRAETAAMDNIAKLKFRLEIRGLHAKILMCMVADLALYHKYVVLDRPDLAKWADGAVADYLALLEKHPPSFEDITRLGGALKKNSPV